MIKNYLLAPGPTPVPPRVLLAMAQPIIHHRTPQFSEIFAEAKRGLQAVFQTAQDVLILAASGTGAMEGSVTNLFSPGEEVLVINGGKFGERWGKIAAAYGLKITELRVEWGQGARVEDVRTLLDKHPAIRGVLVQASETSTAAVHPIEAIAQLTRQRDTLFIVDGITAVGVCDIPMDRWGIDVLITGSQKALMLPPGLAFLALSERAWQRAKQAKLPRFYFDLAKERDNLAKDTTAWTPAISLIIGLREALAMMREESLPRVFARHARMAAATRAAAKAMSLRLVAPDAPSPALTGIYTPPDVDGGKLVAYLRDRMGVTFAGGQDQLKGKIVRIAHLGYMGVFDVVTAIAAFEMALRHFKHDVPLGRGVGAAEDVLMAAMPE
ncbi:MAG TPA: alanine--glyoxylate aminotransferase family protein [Candidatus Acidoferrales bacterium]|nr:alanine--glyoxylate aminotransferase family protein [Candidatus Acidoferrales bacterium]